MFLSIWTVFKSTQQKFRKKQHCELKFLLICKKGNPSGYRKSPSKGKEKQYNGYARHCWKNARKFVLWISLWRREMYGTLPCLKIILRHVFWIASILSDNSLEMLGCQTGQTYSRVRRRKERKILKQYDLGHINLLRSLRRENAVFVPFKKSLAWQSHLSRLIW